jgi:hypothetical protein
VEHLKKYILLLVAAGYIFLLYGEAHTGTGFTLCLFRNLTGMPCPACGTGHALQHLLRGDMAASLATNPFGMLVFVASVYVAGLILYDLLLKRDSFGAFLAAIGHFFMRRRALAVLCVALALINWGWNIIKYNG